jgi:hypothetical protein
MSFARSGFASVQHGFHFVNSFQLPFPPTIQLPLVGDVNISNMVYGLCGGMCFATLDYYYAGLPVPDYKSAEELPFAYLLYLWDRQLDTLGLLGVPKVLEWMLQDDRTLATRTSRSEVPKIRNQLDQGDPVVLCVIRGRGFSDPTVNHQVLATGYEYDESTRQMTLFLCDPNYAGQETLLTMNLAHPKLGLQASHSTGELMRGCFSIPYNWQPPPLQ